jgi:hypothetical protein
VFGPAPFIGRLPDVIPSYEDFDVLSNGNVSTITHSSMAFGTAFGSRKIAVAIASSITSSRVIQSVTIGGVAAARQVKTDTGSPTIVGVEIWTALVPTGTSGNVVLTLDAAPSFGSETKVFLYNLRHVKSATATDTGVGSTSTTIDIEEGGAAIGIFQRAGGAHTWTGLTEDDDQTGASAASLASEDGESGLSVSVSGGINVQILLAVAAFR